MKKIAFIGLSVLVLACGEKKSNTDNEEVVTIDTEARIEGAKEEHFSAARTATFNDSLVADVYDNYNELKTALVNTDAGAAKSTAANLKTALEEIDGNDALKEQVSTLSNTGDIEQQRELFSQVTAGIKALVEGKIEQGTLYYEYCPMAFNGKGAYWISNDKKIYNPYFGDKMLNCGTVDAEIN
tara:strand:- start:364 stop:915 length:552 start_codon:yes stop_codon:yes gene_type:complete